MKFNVKKLTSLLTASLLLAGGLVGLTALPASATDASAPPTFLDYENKAHLSASGGLGYNTGSNATWGDYVNDGPTGGDASFGNMMIKGTKGPGDSSISLTGATPLAATDSLVSSTTRTVTMKFLAPEAGKSVRLDLQTDGYWATISATATTVTTGSWQTLTFVFASSENFANPYNRAAIHYDPSSTTALQSPNNVMFIDNVSFNGGVAQAGPLNATSTLLNFSNGLHTLASFDNSVASIATPPTSKTTCSAAVKVTKGTTPYNLYSVAKMASFSDRKLASSTTAVMTVNMYAPTAGKTVLFKLARTGVTAGLEKTVTTTLGWQRVSVDFSTATSAGSWNESWDSSASYTELYVGVDFGINGSTLDYYFDDFGMNGATTPSLGSSEASCATQDVDVRLVSSQKNTGTDAYEWTGCANASWCVTNSYFMKMIAAGATTTLNYVVTGHGTSTPVSGATVHLRMNTAYSGTNATWSSNGTNFPGVSGGTGNDGGYITGTTNSSGEVSFTFDNTNSSGEASRTLNNSSPYPAGCSSPAGQTKGALQPEVTALTSGAGLGTQYVDVLWPHISSATINSSIAAGSDGSNCVTAAPARPGTKVWSPAFDANNNGHYPHIRLEKSFLNEKLDGTWWDGVWQYRDADTRAYLKYIPAGSTFALTYTVTNEWGQPYEGAKVSLIVNANYSCSKTYFAYEGSLIGPDDCAGGGQTELPAKVANSKGQVTFVLTNTNTNGEAMPVDLNGAPNPATKELGTNIKPHVVGATQEGFDMLFAHFVSETGKAKATGPAAKSATIGTAQQSEFVLTDESGNPITNTDVKYFVNGFDSKVGFAHTDYQGKVTIRSTNSSGQEGMQTVGVSLARDGKLPIAGTATLNWVAPELNISATGEAGNVMVKVAGAAGKTVQITVAGKSYRRLAQGATAEFAIPASAGKKAVKVVVAGKTLAKSVTVTK